MELGSTAINVLTRHTIAICSFVKCTLKLYENSIGFNESEILNFFYSKHSLQFIKNVNDTPDIRDFVFKNASCHWKESMNDLL